MFYIFTVCCGRFLYLKRTIAAFEQFSNYNNYDFTWKIVFQEINPDEDILDFISTRPFSKNIFVDLKNGKKEIGHMIQEESNKIDKEWFFKLDDDAAICSPDFLDVAYFFTKQYEQASFSAFPVGLIDNLGGPQSIMRKVIYDKNKDTYYTIRYVNHIGGFCRITNSSLIKEIDFSMSPDNGHAEDVLLSCVCKYKKIPMFYLENGLIVEHQESTLGQKERCEKKQKEEAK